MCKAIDSVEALRFVLTATKDEPDIRAFEVPRNVAEDILSELDRLREFVATVRSAREKASTYAGEAGMIRNALDKLDARATGGEGT